MPDDVVSAREVGRLTAEVQHMKEAVSQLSADVRMLVDQANKQKGAAWATLGIGSTLGSALGFLISYFGHR